MSSRRSPTELVVPVVIRRGVHVAALAVVLSLPCIAQMGSWREEVLLMASDANNGGDLGSSVTLDGNTAAAGCC